MIQLRPGIHELTLQEIEEKFCFNERRHALFKRARKAIRNLIAAGVRDIYIDGSFVEDRPNPMDIDGCWIPSPSVNSAKIDPVLFDFSNGRWAMKQKYGVDFFLGNVFERTSGKPFLEFFQTDREGNPKGIVKIKL